MKIAVTEEMVTAALDWMPGEYIVTKSEDDNRYCNPPRRRELTHEEERAGVREMLEAAFATIAIPDFPGYHESGVGCKRCGCRPAMVECESFCVPCYRQLHPLTDETKGR